MVYFKIDGTCIEMSDGVSRIKSLKNQYNTLETCILVEIELYFMWMLQASTFSRFHFLKVRFRED
jgi:hypothetical protein